MREKSRGRAAVRKRTSAPSRPAKKKRVRSVKPKKAAFRFETVITSAYPSMCHRCYPPCYKPAGHLDAERATEEAARGHREMIAPDIGCLNWQVDDDRGGMLRINRVQIPRPWPSKPGPWWAFWRAA